MRRASEMPWIDRLTQVGIRGVGSAREEELAEALGFGSNIYPAGDLHEGGLDPVLNSIPADTAALVTLDCDALDPSTMPAVKAPLPGGLTYRQVMNPIQRVARKARVPGFNQVECVPERDVGELGALTAARIVMNMMGALARSGR